VFFVDKDLSVASRESLGSLSSSLSLDTMK
jgi:hypothetical protein